MARQADEQSPKEKVMHGLEQVELKKKERLIFVIV